MMLQQTPLLTPSRLAQAKKSADQMSVKEQEAVFDEIHNEQPNLLNSILAIHKDFGTGLDQVGILLQLLLETWLAMKSTKQTWPLITEQMMIDSLERLIAKMAFVQNLSGDLFKQATTQHVNMHPEPYLLARLQIDIEEQGWLPIKDDLHQRVLLTGQNLVECVGDASSKVQQNVRSVR